MPHRLFRFVTAVVCAGLASLVLASFAAAYSLGPYPGSPVTIPATGTGSPYPSNFDLGSARGKLTGMTVQVNLSHTFTADIDLLLVGPDGTGVLLMSDVCGSQATSGLDLTFSDTAPSGLPDTATCSSGTFRPTDFSGGSNTPEAFPAPAPSTWASSLSAFNGIDPTGPWNLYAVDDAPSDQGAVNSWSITFDVTGAEIDVPESFTSGKAAPYPSTRTYETPPGQVVESLKVNIDGFGHESPADVDILLADDKSNAAVVMSDACGTIGFYGYNWTFSDSDPDLLPEAGDCFFPDGVQPTDYLTSPDDEWPAPAPKPQFGNFSDVFGGREGGKWNLYVVDDSDGGEGYINGWSLELSTRPATSTVFMNHVATLPEGAGAKVGIRRDGPSPYGPSSVGLKAVSGTAKQGADFVFKPERIRFGRRTIGVDILPRIIDDGVAEKPESFRIVMSDPDGDAALSGAGGSVKVTIPASKNARLKLGRLKLNRSGRSGTLVARVTAPGRLGISGPGLKPATTKLKKAGKAKLPIRFRGSPERTRVKVTYRSLGGFRVSRSRMIGN